MSRKLGVLIIHGMGSQDSDFAQPMIEELRKRIGKIGSDAAAVCWKSAWWAPVLSKSEDALLKACEDQRLRDFFGLRDFVVRNLGDAVAYQKVPVSRTRISVYEEVHKVIAKCVRELRGELGEAASRDGGEAPLVVIAHSLGCHMFSNYAWDMQHPPARQASPDNAFERMETLCGIATFGCNIPLFTLAYNDLIPITFPPAGLAQCFPPGTPADSIRRAAKWINLYDPDDVLGYPLRNLSEEYGKVVSADIRVNVGGVISSWNPLSHSEYWTAADVTVPISRMIHRILKLL